MAGLILFIANNSSIEHMIKGLWIFNPGGMAIKRFSTEIGLACLAVKSLSRG